VTVFFRALKILRIAIYYRLDQVLPKQLPWPLRWLFSIGVGKQQSRGWRLRRACEELGPIFVKFGQLLSTRPDLLPADIISELSHLQDNVPPFDSQHFHRLVADALEQPLAAVFSSLDKQPLASASVAQVHSARLHDGREVVVKVIRPNIENVINKDTRLLLWVARLLEYWLDIGKRLRLVEVVEDYRHTILDELDLQREAANASQLRRNFANSPLLYVPEVYWEYSSRQLLVMERIYGIPVNHVDTLIAQGTDMKYLAERGIEIFFTQVFVHNFFHADMHPGNIFVAKDHVSEPQYIAVDMAIVGSLTRGDQYYLARNLLAMFRRDYRQVAELHVQSGWVPKDTRINDLESAIRTVCEPIFEKPLSEISFSKTLITLFNTAQRFNMVVQPQLVLLQKTLLNIEGLGRQLYPQLDLWQTAHPFLERWIKQRFHPKSLIRELRRYAPEWMEKFPEIPMKIYRNLEHLETVGEMLPYLVDSKRGKTTAKAKEDGMTHNRRNVLMTVVVSATIGAIATSGPSLLPQLAEIPMISWMLVGIAGIALLWSC
jgi:ubiquinone biosynthesis protein